MKKLLLIPVTLCFVAVGFAQQAAPTSATKRPLAEVSKMPGDKHVIATKFHCPKCDYVSTKTGKCPTHNVDLIAMAVKAQTATKSTAVKSKPVAKPASK